MTGLTTDLLRFRLPLREALTTARGEVLHRDGLLFSIGDGTHVGWGEATPLPGWSVSDIDSSAAALATVSVALSVVEDPDDPRLDHLLDDLEPEPTARAALSGAIADLRARRSGLSLAATLSVAPTSTVAVNAMVSAMSPGDVAEQAAAAAADGYRTLKVKVGVAETAVDIERLSAVRGSVGPAMELRIDANGAWDVETAVAVLDDLAEFDISFCEEPTEGIEAIAAVGARSAIPVAIDESARSVDHIAAGLATGSIDVVIVKPQALGGPDLAIRAVRLAAEFGATAVVTSMIDGAIGVAHALHVAAASGLDRAHGLATSTMLKSDVGPAPEMDAGRMFVPDTAGIGIDPFETLPN